MGARATRNNRSPWVVDFVYLGEEIEVGALDVIGVKIGFGFRIYLGLFDS